MTSIPEPHVLADAYYSRLEREWLEARAFSRCEDCACYHQTHAGGQEVESVMSTIAHLCRKSPDVERTWDSVLGDIRDAVECAIECHGWCSAYKQHCYGDDSCDDCDEFVPFT